MNKFIFFILVVFSAIAISILNFKAFSKTAKVVQVIDGDTFRIKTGQKVRLVGMDTPELHHPKKPVQCYVKEAMPKTKELIEGKTVRLEKDVPETYRYGRFLRFVYLDDLFLNEYLVKEGYAHVFTFPPDVSKVIFFDAMKEKPGRRKKVCGKVVYDLYII